MFPIKDTQPSYTRPVVTMLFIVMNVLVFLYQVALEPYALNHFIESYALIPAHFRVSSVFTSMFMHGGWMHLLGNMWFLWIFGDNIEDTLGHGKFALFYLLCGGAAAMGQVLLSGDSTVPMVGASGAIAGVMGGYIVRFPHARITTLVFILFFVSFIEVPASIMLAYWFLIQLFSGLGSIGRTQAGQGGVAWFAHVGGFVAGLILIKIMGARERYSRRRDVYW
ncbi:MAG TPA: rhomboid family intramembrane serine protease [Bryobacteraceae bacterium]|nr:rhomboid family intramembrane serine protease [Bryobacteraceae bacterium]